MNLRGLHNLTIYEFEMIATYSNLKELLNELNEYGKNGWKVVACLEGMVIVLMREK